MATLAANKPRSLELGDDNHIPIIASDTVYEGAMVGRVIATGHGRPLAATDKFAGVALQQCANESGSAADKNIWVRKRGAIQLSVAGAVITDLGQPVYATDDDTFGFTPVSAVFIGYVKRFVSAGVAVVEYDADAFLDPYAHWGVREELTGTKTFDAQDGGKAFFVTAAGDDDALTFPAIASGMVDMLIVAIGAYGTTKLELASDANDAFQPTDLTATADKDLLLTKATQQRGDSVLIDILDADGYSASLGNIALGQASIWTKEA